MCTNSLLIKYLPCCAPRFNFPYFFIPYKMADSLRGIVDLFGVSSFRTSGMGGVVSNIHNLLCDPSMDPSHFIMGENDCGTTKENISITSSEWTSVPVMYSFFVSEQTSPFWGLGGENISDSSSEAGSCWRSSFEVYFVPSGWGKGKRMCLRLPLPLTISSPLKKVFVLFLLKN